MIKSVPASLLLSIGMAIALMGIHSPALAQETKGLRVVSDRAVTGFQFPESVAYDSRARGLYVSQFGSALKPAEKDGQRKISKVSLDGKVLEDRFLPAHGETLHKPKGIWVKGDRL